MWVIPLTQDFIKSQLEYNPENGVMIWKVDRPNIKVKGKRAGTLDYKGYRIIGLCGKLFKEHRLIWIWMTGEDPGKLCIDHINRVKSDNKWTNLRLATKGENLINSIEGGPNRGVHLTNNGKYRVWIEKEGTRYNSTHNTLEEARSHHAKLEKELYGKFACNRDEK